MALRGDGRHLPDRPAEDRLALLAQRRPAAPPVVADSIHECWSADELPGCAPSEPHTVGPMPGGRTGRRRPRPRRRRGGTRAERSAGSMKSEIFSTPMTSTLRALPPRIMCVGQRRPRSRSRRTRPRCRTPPPGSSRAGRRRSAAADGVWNGYVIVARMTASMSAPSRPARSIATRPAISAMSAMLSSAAANRRVKMPDRDRIHSSEESMNWQISSLVTTRSGR